MKSGSTTTWAIGTILLCALVGALAYLLAIRPELDATAEAQDAYKAAADYNDLLDTQIANAEATAAQVPEWRGTIEAIRLDMPALPEQPTLHRLLVAALTSRQLPVITISYGDPATVEPPGDVATAPEPAPAEEDPTAVVDPTATADPGDGTDGSDAPAPAPAPSSTPGFTDLVSFTVSITTQGNPASILGLMSYLQTQDDRFLSVTGFTIAPAPTGEGRPGVPQAAPGDWSASIEVTAYSLKDPILSYPVEEPGTVPHYTDGSSGPSVLPNSGGGA